MKKLILCVAIIGFMVFATPAISKAGDFDEWLKDSLSLKASEPGLQHIFDSLGYDIDADLDELGNETFCALPGQNLATIVIEVAGSATTANSGWYVAGNTSVLNQLFSGSALPGDSATFTVSGGDSIGFYMEPNYDGYHLWVTQQYLNSDSFDHARVYSTGNPHEYLICWEDLSGGGDADYNDLILKIRFANQAPIVTLPQDQTYFQCQPEQICFDIDASDANCEGDTLTLSMVSGEGSFTPVVGVGPLTESHCFTPSSTDGTYRFIFKVTDELGAEDYDTLDITVDINDPPVITCPADLAVSCEESTDPSNTGSATATDDHGPAPTISYTDTETPGACPQEKTISRRWKAVDECGDSAICIQTITVSDDEAPVITCPSDLTVDCGASTDPSNTGTATATDNCDTNIDITYSDATNGNIITRTWTAVDDCDNSITCDQTITIEDTTAPTLTCPNDVTVQCVGDVPPVDIGAVTVSDDCDPSPVVTHISDVSDGNTCPEVITRTYRATDATGNFSECQQIITIDDTEAPVITCPSDLTVDCGASTDPSNTGTATATDNCDTNIDITYSDAVIGNVITRTWTAVDDCDNSITCDQTITIEDTTAPTLTCPNDVTVQCVGDVPPVDIGSVTVSDDCDPNPVVTHISDVSDGNTCPEVITRTYRATDATGNFAECQQTITIDDTEAPVITCPSDLTVDCGASTDPSNTGTATATDNCDQDIEITYTDNTNGNVITRTWTAVDDCDNSSSCDQIITIEDTTPPTLTCPNDVTVQCVGDVPPVNIGAVTVSDDCDPSPVVTHISDVSDGNTCPEVITRTYRATDVTGNFAECQQIITVDDTEAPVITCPADLTVDCGASTDPSNAGTATATDNCDQDIEITYTDNTNGNVITRTWTAVDDCNNSASCDQTITIEDTTPPTLTCPNDVTAQCIGDVPPVDIGSVTVSDDCDPNPVVTHISDVSDGNTCPEVITRTYRATDATGNFAECQQIITIDDTEAPVITCPSDMTVDCGGSIDPSNTGTATATDNCDTNIDITYTDNTNGNVITRTWTAVDDCNNSASCDQTITIEDATPPTLTCPNDVTAQCIGDVPPIDIGSVTASDDCDPNPVVTHISDVSDGNTCPEVITRTYRATDATGNFAECQQIITVDDTEAPVITCPDDLTVPCNGSTDPANTGMASATDNCDQDLDITYTDNTNGNVITRTWTAVDDCDNSITCDQTITFEANSAPECSLPNDTTITLCDGNWVCLPVSATDPDDNLVGCEITSGPGTLENGQWCYTASGAGAVNVNIKCTDECGEFCEGSFEVTFIVNNAPVLNAAMDIDTFMCDAGDQICFNNSATDDDLPDDNLTFELTNAPGGASINDATGQVCFTPGSSGTYNFTVRVTDDCEAYDEDDVVVHVTENQPPTILAQNDYFLFTYCPDADPVERCFNGFTVSDPDHSANDLTISKVSGPGTYNPTTHRTCFTPDVYDSTYSFIYKVSDPCGAEDFDTIDVEIMVYDNCDSLTCLEVSLGDTACVYNGTYIQTPVMLENFGTSLGGFELLITYDASAFTFIEALRGEAISDWEYFTYRTGPFGNCGSACPSGMILIVAIADINNGIPHPPESAFEPSGLLAWLRFYVTDNREYGGQSFPLGFFWMDCTNNMFSSRTGDTVFVDKRIYNAYDGLTWDEFDDINFPENERLFGVGATDECIIGDKTAPIRCIIFNEGFISICHPDSIDARGDINLNEVPNEIGDAVLYTNFFIYGMPVFTVRPFGQVAASDVNADGKTLTVGDLVYLIRILTGDCAPIPKLVPFVDDAAITSVSDGDQLRIKTNSNVDLGAVRLSFAVDNAGTKPEVKLADNLEGFKIKYDVVDGNLNVLVYSFETRNIPAGTNDLVMITGDSKYELVSAQASDYNGNEVNISLNKTEVPREFALSQNYPNPFNPETEIRLSLPESSNWTLEIYNIKGQLVRQFDGYSDAGTVSVIWDSRDDFGNTVASGIYFYRATVGEKFSQTRKMVLIK